MGAQLRYLNDAEGNLVAVQVPVEEWERIVGKASRYERIMKMRSELAEALHEVDLMRRANASKS